MSQPTTVDQLFPIGSRIIYEDKFTNTKGKGTIVGYNGIHPITYLQTSFEDALRARGEDLNQYLPERFWQSKILYNVDFDPPNEEYKYDPTSKRIYDCIPEDSKYGFSDACDHNGLSFATQDQLNIFPNHWARVVGRGRASNDRSWGPWIVITEKAYLKHYAEEAVARHWEFCVRPLPKPRPHFSPKDGSFYPLSLGPDSGQCHPKGYLPPYGILVEFNTYSGDMGMKKGLAAKLGELGPDQKHEIVFVSFDRNGKKAIHFYQDVIEWRELFDYNDLPPALLRYTELPRYLADDGNFQTA